MATSCRQLQAFTLIELAKVLAVIAILCALALPPFMQTVRYVRADTLRTQIHVALTRARHEAIIRKRIVSACASVDGLTCTRDWNEGWIIYEGRGDPVSRQQVLHRGQRAPTPDLAARSNRRMTLFYPNGSSSAGSMSISLCLEGREHSKVVINFGGRISARRARKIKFC